MAISTYVRLGLAVGFAVVAGCNNSDESPSCAIAGYSVCNLASGQVCVDLQSDSSSCGQCGNICPTGTACTNGTCMATASGTCVAPSTDCNGVCANTATDPNNCGACANVCATDTPYCNSSACSSSCTAPLSACGLSCVDILTDTSNCGTCGSACATGQSCVNGGCTTGTTGTGGASGTGGGTSTGGATSASTEAATATELSCSYTNAKGVSVTKTIPAADVVSDFSGGKNVTYSTTTRGGTAWYGYGDAPESNPETVSNTTAFNVDTTVDGPCSADGALHFKSPGGAGFGAAIGVNFVPVDSAGKKGLYSATADGYTGVGFFMKCSVETQFVFFKIPDAVTDGRAPSAPCTDATCNQYGVKNNVVLANQWTYYPIYFSETLQDWDGTSFGTGIDATKLTALQIQVNTKYSRDGGTRVANPFECWIDDVHMLTEPPPTTPTAPAAGYTTSFNSSTSVTSPTTGNKIYDPNGNEVRLHGLARPSFEWDRAGFGITREDIQRMTTCGINVVRFSVNQIFWQDSAKGAVYQKYIQRAVNWALQEGLAVIIDLHWTTDGTADGGQAAMADRNAIAFWTSVAGLYQDDGRVIFELYNEPFLGNSSPSDGNWSVWKNGDGTYAGMQEMYAAVRAAGADNLVLIGGLDWAFTLSGVYDTTSGFKANGIAGYNLAYVTHPYQWKATTSSIPAAYGNLAAVAPVVATEFGDAGSSAGGSATATYCNEARYTDLLADFNNRGMSYTGWAWLVDSDRCAFPTLLDSYDGVDTTEAGAVVKAALLAVGS